MPHLKTLDILYTCLNSYIIYMEILSLDKKFREPMHKININEINFHQNRILYAIIKKLLVV